ncbi:glutamine amidotransferase-related protein [Falsirhodobacter halotolerans]|uniref:glutamine amidotransferase-related protein n=1 Tax=Falsirhodobacter halotolerans TaxID=1146892 RepID=UPI001FD05ABE|nr:gamma-glutamyl-gamma-aminobutyrate hydrolase family protein [Falsirhodobacter halotolerans]MCJ8140890.1 gamma-glutamyl-gamma-aminobutyrate hydrolase family protein [Falsirhodobacter halotolerans]
MPLRILVVSSETAAQQEERRAYSGAASHEIYAKALRRMRPDIDLANVSCVSPDPAGAGDLSRYSGVIFAGSPIQMHEDSAETRAAAAFMARVFSAGVPSFGSCAGMQIAAVAAGGATGPRKAGTEVAFARDITRAPEGEDHPLLAGRPATWAAPAMHSSVVTRLPPGARLLASNPDTPVEAVEIRHGTGLFWGVQYHPELSLREIAASLCHQGDEVIAQGLAQGPSEVRAMSDRLIALNDQPQRRDLAWQTGLTTEVTLFERRTVEIDNFLRALEAGG